jgi:hypothetical protein
MNVSTIAPRYTVSAQPSEFHKLLWKEIAKKRAEEKRLAKYQPKAKGY